MCRASTDPRGGYRCTGTRKSSPKPPLTPAERYAAKRDQSKARATRYRTMQLRQADDAQAFVATTRALGLADRATALEQHIGRLGKQQGSHRAERAVLSAELAQVQGAISAAKRAEFLRAIGVDPTLSNADVTRTVYRRAGLPQPSDEVLAAVYRDGVQDTKGQGTGSSDGVAVDRNGAPLPQFDTPPERIEKAKPKRRTKALERAEERLADLERMGASPESIAVARRRVEALTPEPGQPAPRLPSKPLAKARKAVADAVAAGADQGTVDALRRKADALKPKVHPVIDDPAAPIVAQVPSPSPSVTPSPSPSVTPSPSPSVTAAGQTARPPRLAPSRTPGAGMARTRARVYADGTVATPDDLVQIDDARGFAAREQAEVDAIEFDPRRAVDDAKLPQAMAQVQAVIAAERAKGTTNEQLRKHLSDAVLSMRRSDNPEMHEAFLDAMRSLEWR